MDDDEQGPPLTGALDPVKPWTIKAVSTEVRDLAIVAARKEGVTVGQWLEKRIREWCSEVSPGLPGSALAVTAGRPGTADRFEAAERMAKLALEMANASPEARQDPLVKAARTTVKSLLTGLR